MSATTEPASVSPADYLNDPLACVRRVIERFSDLSSGIRHTWAHQMAVEALQDVVEDGTDDPKLEAFFIAVGDTLEMLENLQEQARAVERALNDAALSFDPEVGAQVRAWRDAVLSVDPTPGALTRAWRGEVHDAAER